MRARTTAKDGDKGKGSERVAGGKEGGGERRIVYERLRAYSIVSKRVERRKSKT